MAAKIVPSELAEALFEVAKEESVVLYEWTLWLILTHTYAETQWGKGWNDPALRHNYGAIGCAPWVVEPTPKCAPGCVPRAAKGGYRCWRSFPDARTGFRAYLKLVKPALIQSFSLNDFAYHLKQRKYFEEPLSFYVKFLNNAYDRIKT